MIINAILYNMQETTALLDSVKKKKNRSFWYSFESFQHTSLTFQF